MAVLETQEIPNQAVLINQALAAQANLEERTTATPETTVASVKGTRAKAKECFPPELIAILKRPLPSKAITEGTRGMSSIKNIYITERLNEAFGEGRWYSKAEKVDEAKGLKGQMVVQKVYLTLLDYPWFYSESCGGHENADLGDSYKGAVSDALSKICAVAFGIGADVYKGDKGATSTAYEKSEAAAAKAAASLTHSEAKDEKKAIVAAAVVTNQATVANPPDCADCLLVEGADPRIKTWEHPATKKRYDAVDLIKASQKKYQLDLCGHCQSSRASELKAQTTRIQ